MIILLLGTIVLLLFLNMLYAEYRLTKKDTEIDMMSRYNKLLLLRRFK